MQKTTFSMRRRNPDVLSCIANLSSDEVFTSPELANSVLDSIELGWASRYGGANIWRDSSVTFLDPCSKSGVFLREITKRLIEGLEDEIPDRQERVDHILTKQVFGIGLTTITALMSRRSVYCSKWATGKHSIVKSFDNIEGNIWFERTEHKWKKNKCTFCGARKSTYARGDVLESHAYKFIHIDKDNNLSHSVFGKDMQFDVIVGNPPYQLNDGGGTGSSAVPIYHKFVDQAKKINPKFLSFIIPARWFTGGRGLDKFRESMLADTSLQILHDYPDASDCFPGVEIKGGVCYFLWNNSYDGDCTITRHKGGENHTSTRPLLEKGATTFIRQAESIPILRKVQAHGESSFMDLVSSNDPFGYDQREKGSMKRKKPKYELYESFEGSCEFYYNGWRKNGGPGHIDTASVRRNQDWVKEIKILVPKAWGTGDQSRDKLDPFIAGPNSSCTETYLVIGPFESEKIANNVISYINTKFFHFFAAIIKNTQNTMKGAYLHVPVQDFNEKWSDEKLYKKYDFTQGEIDLINSLIWPEGTEDE